MRVAPAEREFLFTPGIYFGGGRKARNPWIHPHPPICAREHLVCRRNQAAFDGRILPSSRGREGIYGHPHLQEKSPIARGILDRHGRVLPRLNPVAPVVHRRLWYRTPKAHTEETGRRCPLKLFLVLY